MLFCLYEYKDLDQFHCHNNIILASLSQGESKSLSNKNTYSGVSNYGLEGGDGCFRLGGGEFYHDCFGFALAVLWLIVGGFDCGDVDVVVGVSCRWSLIVLCSGCGCCCC